MKKVIIICIALLTVMAISCKKDSTTTSTKQNPTGFWKGQWSNASPSTPPNLNYLWLIFKSDGTLRQIYGADTTSSNQSTGTWAMVNDSVISWTNLFPEYYHGVIRSNSTAMQGIWGSTSGVDTIGQFALTKQ